MIKIEDFCITPNYTLKEVMEVMERNQERGLIVLNEERKVCGFVSQGDIIKALVDGKSLYTYVSNIMSHSIIQLTCRDMKKASEIFIRRNLSLIPVVNEEGFVSDVITPRDVLKCVKYSE